MDPMLHSPSKDDFERSYSRCISVGDRVKQYFVEGRFFNCSELIECSRVESLAFKNEVDEKRERRQSTDARDEGQVGAQGVVDRRQSCNDAWRRFEGTLKASSKVPMTCLT